MKLHVGISTCPNDTYAFSGLLTGAVPTPGLELELELCDVEELNTRFAAGEFDVAKLSFAAMLQRAPELWVLPAGAALGYGVGPVVLARPGRAADAPLTPDKRVLAPGANTTATLLWQLFHAGEGQLDQAVFHAIMPALERGEADLGVCIHEGRFTYAEAGLTLVEDLGATWEAAARSPLPLGGIAARRSLGRGTALRVADALRRSLAHADADPEATLPTMARHAQDPSAASCFEHVKLYVNAWTRDLGAPGGPEALAELSARAAARGLAPSAGLEWLPFEAPTSA